MREIHGKLVYDSLGEIINPKHAAVLVVDMQNDFCAEGGHMSHTPGKEGGVSENRKILPNLVRFIDEARKAGVLIVWIVNTYFADWHTDSPAWLYVWTKAGMHTSDIPFCQEGTWGWEIVDELKPLPDELKPLPNEPIVRKYRSSGFRGTCLDLLLRASKIESVIVTGTARTACVEKTAIDATLHDYYVVMVRDCVAPYDETLVTVPYYDVVTSEEVLKGWASLRARE